MTEKIVIVLKRMKCPHRLEPHQIQGLDFIHIYPVVQVKMKRILLSSYLLANVLYHCLTNCCIIIIIYNIKWQSECACL